jgi:phosphatidylinositol 3-kinase
MIVDLLFLTEFADFGFENGIKSGKNRLFWYFYSTLPLFSKRGIFRQGIYDLRVWPFLEADGSMPSLTPGKLKGNREDSQMIRLAKLTKKHRNGMIEKVDWLDRLTFREIELINEKEKRSANIMFLMVEFALVHFSGQEFFVIFFEKNGDQTFYFQSRPEIVRIPDPEIGLENLVEAKQLALSRASRTSAADRDLKPNAAARNQLNKIIGFPSTAPLSTDEKNLL